MREASQRGVIAESLRAEWGILRRALHQSGRFAAVFAAVLALLLALVGRAAFTSHTATSGDERRLLIRAAALFLVAGLGIMVWRGFPSFSTRLHEEASRGEGALHRALVRAAARQAFAVALPMAAGNLALYLGFLPRKPMLVLYAAELTLIFLGVGVGLFTLALRVWSDTARRMEEAPGPGLRLLHQGACFGAGAAYAAGVWHLLRPWVGEALLTGLALGGALFLLAFNGAADADEELRRRLGAG